MRHALPQSFLVAGISIRYDVEPDGYGGLVSKLQNHTAVNIIQVAVYKEVYIFQVTELQEKANAPPNLLSLLSSIHIIKVGHSIHETHSRLANLWSIEGLKSQLNPGPKTPQILDLGVLAKAKGVVSDAKASFIILTGLILGQSINQSNALSLSDWSQ
jgi:hypothetical protein